MDQMSMKTIKLAEIYVAYAQRAKALLSKIRPATTNPQTMLPPIVTHSIASTKMIENRHKTTARETFRESGARAAKYSRRPIIETTMANNP
jgi:hypothetical protein